VEEIRARGGAVSFRDFMELALYHSDNGYYSSKEPSYGRAGDYLTAPSASPWYAEVLAAFVADIAGRVGAVTIVDLGSGDGSFVAHLSSARASEGKRWIRELVSIERSESMRRHQLERFRATVPSIRVLAPGADFESSGPLLFHASELYDAMPVHRVVGRGSEIRELWVELFEGELRWSERPASHAVVDYFAGHDVTLKDGQIAEANLAAEATHRAALGRASSEGLALTLDYGYDAARLYDPRGRAGGSLATYRGHRVGRDPLRAPGVDDLTAHVNWNDLRRGAQQAGWSEIGFWPLAEFLVRAGIGRVVDDGGIGMSADLDARTVTERQEVKRLLDPDGMGSDLKVLVQGRGEIVEVASDSLDLP
jgi:SAM-dependent MidA family methyltransferase